MNVKIFFLVIILLIIFKKYLIETMFNTKRENEVNELNTSTDGGGGGGGGLSAMLTPHANTETL